ncbi:MAG TPA: hypothetical protein VFW06_10780 [Acidimicrobiia bacterium]|nr:hypothetical protein [Acidimicrobiia bacterium]
MADEEPVEPTPDAPSTPNVRSPNVRSPNVRSEEALARSKDEVTPRFKEPKAPKKPSRWAPGRKLGSRPFQ